MSLKVQYIDEFGLVLSFYGSRIPLGWKDIVLLEFPLLTQYWLPEAPGGEGKARWT